MDMPMPKKLIGPSILAIMSLFYSLLEPEAADVLTLILTRLPSCIRGVARALCRGWRDAVQCRGLRVCVTSPVKFAMLAKPTVPSQKFLDYFSLPKPDCRELRRKEHCLRGKCEDIQYGLVTNHVMRKHPQAIAKIVGQGSADISDLSPGYYYMFMDMLRDISGPGGALLPVDDIPYHLRCSNDATVLKALCRQGWDDVEVMFLDNVKRYGRHLLMLTYACAHAIDPYNIAVDMIDSMSDDGALNNIHPSERRAVGLLLAEMCPPNMLSLLKIGLIAEADAVDRIRDETDYMYPLELYNHMTLNSFIKAFKGHCNLQEPMDVSEILDSDIIAFRELLRLGQEVVVNHDTIKCNAFILIAKSLTASYQEDENTRVHLSDILQFITNTETY